MYCGCQNRWPNPIKLNSWGREIRAILQLCLIANSFRSLRQVMVYLNTFLCHTSHAIIGHAIFIYKTLILMVRLMRCDGTPVSPLPFLAMEGTCSNVFAFECSHFRSRTLLKCPLVSLLEEIAACGLLFGGWMHCPVYVCWIHFLLGNMATILYC